MNVNYSSQSLLASLPSNQVFEVNCLQLFENGNIDIFEKDDEEKK